MSQVNLIVPIGAREWVDAGKKSDHGFISHARLARLLKESGEVNKDEDIVQLTITDTGISYTVVKNTA